MNDKQIKEFVELLYPYFKDMLLQEDAIKNSVRRKNATVTSESASVGSLVSVALPYDTVSFDVRNETGADLKKGDLVSLEYNVDLKNAIAVYLIK